MASPQLEDGFLRIARELWIAICKTDLSGAEFRVVSAVIGKTYGWNKPSDEISISQFMDLTAMTRSTICKTTNKLVSKRILGRKINRNSSTTYWIQKDYEKWLLASVQNGHSVQLDTRSSVQTVLQLVSKTAPTIDTIQKTKKDMSVQPIFDYFRTTLQKPRFILTKERRQLIIKRLKEGYTQEQMFEAIDNFSKDDWDQRHKYCDLVYAIGTIRGINNLEKWLHSDSINTQEDAEPMLYDTKDTQ